MSIATVRVSIQGTWQDAWLYKESALLWDRDGTLCHISLDTLMKSIRNVASTEAATFSTLALFRNDWKDSAVFRELASLSPVEEALARIAADFDEAIVIEVRPTIEDLPIPQVPASMLDSEIYANRVYIGTVDGLFETRFNPSFVHSDEDLVQSTDVRTSAVTAKYMSLNVSTGPRGLWFRPITFASGEVDFQVDREQNEDLVRVADQSESTSFAGRNLLNYDGASMAPMLLRSRGRTSRSHQRAQFEEYHVLGYRAPEDLTLRLRSTFQNLVSNRDLDLSVRQIRVVGNSGHRLLVDTGEQLRVVDVEAHKGHETKVRPDKLFGAKSFAGHADDILGTYPMGASFLVETFDDVRIIEPSGVRVIFSGEVAKVRTFRNSRRFREVALLITEDSLEMVGFI